MGNLCCGGPPPASRKYVFHDVQVSKVKLYAYCRLSPGILPDWLTAVVTVLSGFASVMEVDGAKVSLEEQRFFGGGKPFEGSLGALGEQFQKRYSRLYLRALLSLYNNSNLLFRGLLARHTWFPK